MKENIFPYFDGEKKVFGDPEEILSALYRECDYDLDSVQKNCQSENPALAIPAADKVAAAARKAFAMMTYNGLTGEGATREQVLAVFGEFMEWCKKKRNSTVASPTLRLVTDFPEN